MVVHALKVAYLGTHYQGWQRQPTGLTVQEVLELALEAELGARVSVRNASRTDAGVHARGQVVSLRWPVELKPGRLTHGVNHRLPGDVRVLAASRMHDTFDPRHDAVAKTYRYRLRHASVLEPHELDRVVAISPRLELDLEVLEQATALLVGTHNFSAFVLVGGSHSHTVRRIDRATWEHEGSAHNLVLVGSGFLRGMVRSIVGTLLEVGRGRFSVEEFGALLAGRQRGEAGATAPPQGLCLESIDYPFAVPCPEEKLALPFRSP
jgi:tRNA pseudouridine38-40 synthase